jgi:hypothetical protein
MPNIAEYKKGKLMKAVVTSLDDINKFFTFNTPTNLQQFAGILGR